LDWPGLLKWSMKYSDGTSTSNYKQMSDDDIKFIEGAIREAMSLAEDPYELVKEAIPRLNDNDPVVVQTSLRVIDSCLDSADIARNLHTLKATAPLIDLIWHEHEIVIHLALDILSMSLANNPAFQMDVGKMDGLNNFLLRLSHSSSDVIGVKTLGCISALIRNNRSLETQFVESDGFKVLCSAIASTNEKFQQKALNLSAHLIREGVVSNAHVDCHDLVNTLIALLGDRNIGETGIQHGELCANLTEALMAQSNSLTTEKQIQDINEAVTARLEYLKNNQKSFDTSIEREILNNCKKLAPQNV